jgi:hypothetical protein
MPPQSRRNIELHSFVRTYVPQILWHQLLLNNQAYFFQTCIENRAGCVDDRKERNFSCGHFYQSYGPLLLQMLLQQWGISVRGHILVDVFFKHLFILLFTPELSVCFRKKSYSETSLY